jgi:hypothetical protein
VLDAHVVHRHAERPRYELRPRRLVALALGRRAGLDRDDALFVDGARADLGAEAGELDVGAQPDPELLHVAVGAALGLLLAQLVVAGGLEHEVQGARVLARVIGGAGDRLVGEVAGRDEVAPAQLGRVHVELLGQLVHGALDERGRLRAPRSAVGADRRRVGHHAAKAEVHARDHIDAR